MNEAEIAIQELKQYKSPGTEFKSSSTTPRRWQSTALRDM
jgi:hypothetical protein